MQTTHAKGRSRKAPSGAASTPVSLIMTREVISVRTGTAIDSVVELMLQRGLSRIPVVDGTGKPVGIVSKTDLIEESHDRGDDGVQAPRLRRFDKWVEPRGFHEEAPPPNVDDVMTATVITVPEGASVARVAELMVSRHVHGIPVVTRKGELTGFVSTMDVLGWLAGLR